MRCYVPPLFSGFNLGILSFSFSGAAVPKMNGAARAFLVVGAWWSVFQLPASDQVVGDAVLLVSAAEASLERRPDLPTLDAAAGASSSARAGSTRR